MQILPTIKTRIPETTSIKYFEENNASLVLLENLFRSMAIKQALLEQNGCY
jgi:hypothetical protein